MNNISVVISAWNCEDKIERTISSVSWADEIIVVDNDSTDLTVQLAKKFTKKIFHRKNNSMLNVNKNFGFTKAMGDWILCIDSDEVIPPELSKEIKEKVHSSQVVGYWIPRKNIIFGKWIQHGLWWPDKQLRLFRRGQGRFPEKHVHEYIAVDGATADLSNCLIHYNYESVSQYLRKLDTIYTENEVSNLLAAHYQVSWQDAIRFPVSDFLKVYFAQEGYKDGLHGLVLAIFQSFYSFVVFAKLWEKKGFVQVGVTESALAQEISDAWRQGTYWRRTRKINDSSNSLSRLFYRFMRKYASL